MNKLLQINTGIPTYSITIPSTGKPIKYRPFIVKEEKALAVAMETKDLDAMVNTLKSVIEACTFGAVDIETLPLFDLEWIFINLKKQASGSRSPIRVKCKECDAFNDIELNLDTAKINIPKEKNWNILEISPSLQLKFRLPTFSDQQKFQEEYESKKPLSEEEKQPIFSDFESSLRYIATLLETIYNNKSPLMAGKDFSVEDAVEFFESLDSGSLTKVMEFFKNLPQLTIEQTFECGECKASNDVTIRGMDSFF